jgi:hypothetical protein
MPDDGGGSQRTPGEAGPTSRDRNARRRHSGGRRPRPCLGWWCTRGDPGVPRSWRPRAAPGGPRSAASELLRDRRDRRRSRERSNHEGALPAPPRPGRGSDGLLREHRRPGAPRGRRAEREATGVLARRTEASGPRRSCTCGRDGARGETGGGSVPDRNDLGRLRALPPARLPPTSTAGADAGRRATLAR